MKTHKEWTLQALAIAMRKDLAECTTNAEVQLCQAINKKEIRETAADIKQYRKLSPGEIAILEGLNI